MIRRCPHGRVDTGIGDNNLISIRAISGGALFNENDALSFFVSFVVRKKAAILFLSPSVSSPRPLRLAMMRFQIMARRTLASSTDPSEPYGKFCSACSNQNFFTSKRIGYLSIIFYIDLLRHYFLHSFHLYINFFNTGDTDIIANSLSYFSSLCSSKSSYIYLVF